MWIYHKRWKTKRFHKIIIEWSGVMSDLKSESFKRQRINYIVITE